MPILVDSPSLIRLAVWFCSRPAPPHGTGEVGRSGCAGADQDIASRAERGDAFLLFHGPDRELLVPAAARRKALWTPRVRTRCWASGLAPAPGFMAPEAARTSTSRATSSRPAPRVGAAPARGRPRLRVRDFATGKSSLFVTEQDGNVVELADWHQDWDGRPVREGR